jgi:hypothetical protein
MDPSLNCTILTTLEFNLAKLELNLPIQVLCKFISDLSLDDTISQLSKLMKVIDNPAHKITNEQHA